MRRRTAAVTGAVVLGAAAATVLIATYGGASGTDDTTAPSSFDVAQVERRDITRRTTLDGTVGRGAQTPLSIPGDGVLTQLPHVGDVISSGQVLAEVNGEPVVLITGERPVWRDLGPSVADGEDVRQLEQALIDLGYATSALDEADDDWTGATTASVKNLQEALGLREDGALSLGELVFSPRSVRVAAVEAALGATAAEAGITVTGDAQVVDARASTSDADVLAPGTEVTLELPNGTEVPGTIFTVGAPETDDDGATTVPVVVLADGLEATDGLDVEIHVDTVEVADATVAPASALLALAEGGYALEVPDPTAASGTRLVAVEIGAFDEEGWVQVSGIAPGDEVVVP